MHLRTTLAPRPVCCLAVVVRLLWCKNVVVAWPRPGAGKSVVRLCLVPAGAARCAQLSFNDETLPSAADVDPARPPPRTRHPADKDSAKSCTWGRVGGGDGVIYSDLL